MLYWVTCCFIDLCKCPQNWWFLFVSTWNCVDKSLSISLSFKEVSNKYSKILIFINAVSIFAISICLNLLMTLAFCVMMCLSKHEVMSWKSYNIWLLSVKSKVKNVTLGIWAFKDDTKSSKCPMLSEEYCFEDLSWWLSYIEFVESTWIRSIDVEVVDHFPILKRSNVVFLYKPFEIINVLNVAFISCFKSLFDSL